MSKPAADNDLEGEDDTAALPDTSAGHVAWWGSMAEHLEPEEMAGLLANWRSYGLAALQAGDDPAAAAGVADDMLAEQQRRLLAYVEARGKK